MKTTSRFKRYVVVATFLLLGTVMTSFADDWGPQLIPPVPEQTDKEDFMDSFMEDSREYRVPNRITADRLASSRPLPTGQSRRNARGPARPVAFDETLEPRESIIHQGFLEEDATSTPIGIPKALTTNSPRRPLKPQAVYETDEFEEYYIDEYPVHGGMAGGRTLSGGGLGFLASTGGMEYSMDETGGLYDEMSPALESCYVGPPMIKPFGTGPLDNLTFFAGTTGFKNEIDGAGGGGNFGFTEGFNWSGPVTPQCTVSGQLGFRAVQSNINGSPVVDKRSRNQYFVTAGFFKRDLSYPIQGGVVFDWFQDDFYGKVEINQVRCELSLRTFSNLEYGFQGGFGTNDKTNAYIRARENAYRGTVDVNYKIRSDNYYLAFLRKHWAGGGLAEFRLGASDHGDVILSGMGEFPLNDRFSVNGGFTGVIPKEGRSNGGWRRETWDLSVGVVFYFRGGATSKPCNPCRPMFDVAGNGSFMNRIR